MSGGAWAEEWRAVSGEEMRVFLSDRTFDYGGAWQRFSASGRTLYNAGRDSWGYWQIRGDKYCSQWPPGGLWDCYVVERKGEAIRFVGSDGSSTEGMRRPIE